MEPKREDLKNILSLIYKKDMVNSVLCGRENISTKRIKELSEIAPNVPLSVWLNPKAYLDNLRLQENKEKKWITLSAL